MQDELGIRLREEVPPLQKDGQPVRCAAHRAHNGIERGHTKTHTGRMTVRPVCGIFGVARAPVGGGEFANGCGRMRQRTLENARCWMRGAEKVRPITSLPEPRVNCTTSVSGAPPMKVSRRISYRRCLPPRKCERYSAPSS